MEFQYILVFKRLDSPANSWILLVIDVLSRVSGTIKIVVFLLWGVSRQDGVIMERASKTAQKSSQNGGPRGPGDPRGKMFFGALGRQDTWRRLKKPQEAPILAQEAPQEGPRVAKMDLRSPQDRPKRPQESPKWPWDRPKMAQEPPIWLQEMPKAAKRRPR